MNPFDALDGELDTAAILASMRGQQPKPQTDNPFADPSMEAVRAAGAASYGLPQLPPMPERKPPEARSTGLGGSRYGPAVNPGPELDWAIGRGAGLNPFEAGPGLWDQGRKAVEDWRAGKQGESVAEFWGPQVLGIFAGPRAKTANLAKLEEAQRRWGKEPDAQVTRDTGWSQTRDGNWQFEINDNPARLTPASRYFISSRVPGVKTQGTAPLSQMFEHKALVKAYPEVANLRSTLMYEGGGGKRGSSGGFGTHPETGEFVYATFNRKDDNADIRRSFLHELNHWVAKQEGFDPGTSPRTWSKPEFNTLVETQARGLAERDGLSFDQMLPEQRDKYLQGAAMGLYYQTIGEVASRNVERRSDLTAKQRSERPPRDTEDVAWEYQLPSPQRMKQRDDGKFEVSKVTDENPFDFELRPMSSVALHEIGDAQYLTPYTVDPVTNVPIGSLQGSYHKPDRVPALMQQLRENRWLEPLVVDRDNNVIEGQHRLRALQGLGVKEAPVHRIREIMSDQQLKAIEEAGHASGIHREQSRQIAQQIAEIIDKEGPAALSEYVAPRGFEAAWNAAVRIAQSAKSE